jgi:rubrerythrin
MVTTQFHSAVANLVVAFDNEMNAHASYKAFAQQAEVEGIKGAASLFRAAARAEQIHATNHARVIRRMGGEARAEIRPVRVKSTLENLKAALGGEQDEINTLYPTFLKEATSHLDTTAVRSFIWAMESEKTHARLYVDAVTTLENGAPDAWTQAQLDFYVCTLCGYTAKTPEADNCPACNFLWERFEVIR